jgi:hypothetical protein
MTANALNSAIERGKRPPSLSTANNYIIKVDAVQGLHQNVTKA